VLALSATGVVVAVIVALVVVRAVGGSATAAPGAAGAVPASAYTELASVPVAELRAAAHGVRLTSDGGAYPKAVDGPAYTVGGKPGVLYLGAEYCPYCATERWPLVVALAKFGTFTGLHFIHSDNNPSETYRQVPTLSFYGATYTSRYLALTTVEEATVSGTTLQRPTAAENGLASRYDPGASIPFVYLDGTATIVGAEYDPGLLVGTSPAGVAAEIGDGTAPLASEVDADAGVIVSDLCRATGGQPGSVCRAFPSPVSGATT
jgi:hypothetical protein